MAAQLSGQLDGLLRQLGEAAGLAAPTVRLGPPSDKPCSEADAPSLWAWVVGLGRGRAEAPRHGPTLRVARLDLLIGVDAGGDHAAELDALASLIAADPPRFGLVPEPEAASAPIWAAAGATPRPHFRVRYDARLAGPAEEPAPFVETFEPRLVVGDAVWCRLAAADAGADIDARLLARAEVRLAATGARLAMAADGRVRVPRVLFESDAEGHPSAASLLVSVAGRTWSGRVGPGAAGHGHDAPHIAIEPYVPDPGALPGPVET